MRKFLFACVLAAVAASGQSLSGRRAPSFSLPDSSQVQHDILDYRGKWLILTWTTSVNCIQCGPFAKALEPLQKQMRNQLAVLNVMISPPETSNTATKFSTENKITSPIVFDQSQVAIGYFKATPTNSRIDTPHAFIINPQGTIVDDWPDARVGTILGSKGGVAAALQNLMAGKK